MRRCERHAYSTRRYIVLRRILSRADANAIRLYSKEEATLTKEGPTRSLRSLKFRTGSLSRRYSVVLVVFAVRVGVLFQHLGPQQTALSGSPAQSCETRCFYPENFEGADVSLYGRPISVFFISVFIRGPLVHRHRGAASKANEPVH